jgi:hypothetical protein
MTTPYNPFDFLNTPWGKLPLAANSTPGGNLEELEKRINELKTVEQWLSLNLNLLKTTIQGLEVQRGTLAAIQSFSNSFAAAGTDPQKAAMFSQSTKDSAPPAGTPPGMEQAAWWWGSMQDQFGQMMQAAQASAQTIMQPTEAKETKDEKPFAGKKGATK